MGPGRFPNDRWRPVQAGSPGDAPTEVSSAEATAGVAGLPPASTLADATQGVTDNEILIGALGQLTGPFAFIGAPGRDNIQMAIEHLNAAPRTIAEGARVQSHGADL